MKSYKEEYKKALEEILLLKNDIQIIISKKSSQEKENVILKWEQDFKTKEYKAAYVSYTMLKYALSKGYDSINGFLASATDTQLEAFNKDAKNELSLAETQGLISDGETLEKLLFLDKEESIYSEMKPAGDNTNNASKSYIDIDNTLKDSLDKKHKPIYVEWTDSCGCSPRWEFEEEIKHEVLTVKTMGFLIKENDALISVANSIVPETELQTAQITGVMTIPKIAITKRIDNPTL